MRAEEFLDILHAKPFVPVRLFLTDGQTYDIRHPDMVIVMRQRVDIGIKDSDTGLADRVVRCSLLHVVRVEELPVQAPGAAQQANGAG